jgi:hypothetical protein
MNKDTSAALALLGRSEAGNRDLAPRIEGKLPQGLAGALYRNGPGLFERGGLRKTHLLDGDGSSSASPSGTAGRITATASLPPESSRRRKKPGATATPHGRRGVRAEWTPTSWAATSTARLASPSMP